MATVHAGEVKDSFLTWCDNMNTLLLSAVVAIFQHGSALGAWILTYLQSNQKISPAAQNASVTICASTLILFLKECKFSFIKFQWAMN